MKSIFGTKVSRCSIFLDKLCSKVESNFMFFHLSIALTDYFRLNPSTGLLTVNPNRPLDYEEQQQINITIVARDAEGLQSTVSKK